MSPTDIMDRARGAGAYLNGVRRRDTGKPDPALELAAFMSIFHPKIKGKRLRRILQPPSLPSLPAKEGKS